ncbi:TM2 domain-containing membrane protein YozV [Chryseobacterium sp. H1D6B]|uniref:TM2 domain-containing protein n=1 Tax=Chryseobacterium sp. H1D6B TaxID=2940588 RepID=UPI0015CB73ED|nr:TM2 domain-containing protein [Chryseobacterium sp. H1D6B]MDH6250650.1 TM2 domain-containing membrane protein YozV [Chryseobacterium sp. H1D6B]
METFDYLKPENNQSYHSEKKIPAALLGIFVGWLALNKFYLGYTKEGIIQIVLNICTAGAASIIPIIEGVMYLFMSDKKFDDTYVHGKKGWF